MENSFEDRSRLVPYGYCPQCGDVGVMRERRPNGDDTCVNGHKYPSAHSIKSLQQALPIRQFNLSKYQSPNQDQPIISTLDVNNVNNLKADKARLLNLLGDILYEAQNNPMRLVAFNSPLLGIAMIETWKSRHPDATTQEIEEMAKQEYEFRAVIEANRKRDNGL